MNACAMKASSYLPGGQRQDTGQRKSNTSSRKRRKTSPRFPRLQVDSPAPLTETTTPFGPPLSNQPMRFLSTERSVRILSRSGPRVGPNARNGTTTLPLYCQFAGGGLALALVGERFYAVSPGFWHAGALLRRRPEDL